MFTEIDFDISISHRVFKLLGFTSIQTPCTRMALERARKFLKIQTVKRYVCKKTGEEKIALNSVEQTCYCIEVDCYGCCLRLVAGIYQQPKNTLVLWA